MTTPEDAFPSRLLRLRNAGLEAAGLEATVDPERINQHIEGRKDGRRVMVDEEVERLLNDPFAVLVLRRGRFPRSFGEILDAVGEHDASAEGLPQRETYLISEGGQIPFTPGVDKGGSRLIAACFRTNSPELMVSTLLPPGFSPRAEDVLVEVQAWDPVNRTMHFYQREEGAWFWCGQSDMALEPETRGRGPFDSHINGYPIMKELKTPWVHWHGPGVGIAETAFAPDDPLVSDPLFANRDHALNFERRVIRPLMERWNDARFDKSVTGEALTNFPRFMAQVLQATSANLISTHTEFSQLPERDLDDLPPTFFFDQDSLLTEAGLSIQVPPLRMSGKRYLSLIQEHDLRIQGGSIDEQSDVPFCFVVPERAFEDVLVVKILIQRGAISARLAASLLMVDFPNPVGSPRRDALMRYVPAAANLEAPNNLDAVLPSAILEAVERTGPESPEAEFANNWSMGPEAWRDAFADRIEAYLGRVAAVLDTDAGCDDIFRLAESRRRDFARRSLAEFRLSLPHAVGILDDSPSLEMTEQATLRQRP
jgi:hypothetical protein